MFRFMSRMFGTEKEETKTPPKSENEVSTRIIVNQKTVCRTDLHKEIYKKTEELAYLLAEKDGFRGNAIDYWCEAERQVNKELNGKKYE